MLKGKYPDTAVAVAAGSTEAVEMAWVPAAEVAQGTGWCCSPWASKQGSPEQKQVQMQG